MTARMTDVDNVGVILLPESNLYGGGEVFGRKVIHDRECKPLKRVSFSGRVVY